LVVVSLLLFLRPLVNLLQLALHDDNASHIPLIPVIALWLFWIEREKIFQSIRFGPLASIPLIFGALLLGGTAWLHRITWTADNLLSASILSLVLLWIAAFLACFGVEAARKARFELGFLLLMVPPPDFILDRVIYFLQWGSAELSGVLFELCNVPALKEGFTFHLAHVSIEVARECSGIRSSLALLILALVVVHLYFRSFWSKAIFLVVGMAVMVVKNAVRIVTLTLLASYVDPSFLFGHLHRDGGVVFFLLGIGLLIPVFWLLQRFEHAQRSPGNAEVGKVQGN
jgi:exosortase